MVLYILAEIASNRREGKGTVAKEVIAKFSRARRGHILEWSEDSREIPLNSWRCSRA